MSDPVPDVVIDRLQLRRVQRTTMLLGLRPEGQIAVVARDADTGDFVRVPAMPPDLEIRLLAVSPSGQEVLLLTEHDGQRYGGLCLSNLSTGRQRWLSAQTDGQDWLAAISPDGASVASIATVDTAEVESATINLIDVATGRRRRLGHAAGSHSAESAICWSSDGRLIAATYLTDDDEIATLVTDTDGNLVATYDDMGILGGSNGTWASNRELICGDDDGLVIVDVYRGTRRRLECGPRPVLAVLDGRLVQMLPWDAAARTRLVTVDYNLTWLKIADLGGAQVVDLGFRLACGANVRTNEGL